MKQQVVVSGALVLVTTLLVEWLWVYWTPLCNETCPSFIVVAIYLTLALAVLCGIGIATLAALGRLDTRRGLSIYLATSGLVVVCATVITVILRTRGVA